MKKARSVADYLKRASPDKRAALQRLRRAIKSAAPGAEELVSYGMPAFRYEGRVMVWFGAGANHCAFYPGAHPIKVHKAKLRKYSVSKGTIRFQPDNPLPDSLVRTLVRARIAELAGRAG